MIKEIQFQNDYNAQKDANRTGAYVSLRYDTNNKTLYLTDKFRGEIKNIEIIGTTNNQTKNYIEVENLKDTIINLLNTDNTFKQYLISNLNNYNNSLTFKTISDSANIAITHNNLSAANAKIKLNYSKNNGNWTKYNIGDVINLNREDTIAFSGNLSGTEFFGVNGSNCYFIMTGSIQAVGNVMSLLNFTDNLKEAGLRNLFSGCTSLTKASIFSETTFYNYSYLEMFKGCTNLTEIQLPFSKLYGTKSLSAIFEGCSSLNKIEVNFINWGNNYTTNWVNGVAQSGTFIKPIDLPEEYGVDRIPQGWTVVNKN